MVKRSRSAISQLSIVTLTSPVRSHFTNGAVVTVNPKLHTTGKMGELKDWTGEPMTESTDLWKFNGGVEPKFWFGDRVNFQKRSATIIGIEWRSWLTHPDCGRQWGDLPTWCYLLHLDPLAKDSNCVRFARFSAVIWRDEGTLTLLAQTEGEKCPGF